MKLIRFNLMPYTEVLENFRDALQHQAVRGAGSTQAATVSKWYHRSWPQPTDATQRAALTTVLAAE